MKKGDESMAYHIVEVKTHRDLEEEFSNLLLTMGAEGISAEGPQFMRNSIESGLAEIWDEEQLQEGCDELIIKGYFSPSEDWDQKKGHIGAAIVLVQKAYPQFEIDVLYDIMEDDSWQDSWKQYYKPFAVGHHLVIKPLWEPYEAKEGDVVVELDPGLVFGTGDHPTTGGALRLLEEKVKPGMQVMDLGCGTGILGLAAALLGAEKIVAVDRDREALKATTKNFAVNHLSEKLTVVEGDLSGDVSGLEGQFDIIVANIIASVIIDILPLVRKVLKPGGLFIAGGIIRDKKGKVLSAAEIHHLHVMEIREEGDWVTLLMMRR